MYKCIKNKIFTVFLSIYLYLCTVLENEIYVWTKNRLKIILTLAVT